MPLAHADDRRRLDQYRFVVREAPHDDRFLAMPAHPIVGKTNLEGLSQDKERVYLFLFAQLYRQATTGLSEAAVSDVEVVMQPKFVVALFEDLVDDERLAIRALRTAELDVQIRVARDGAEALSLLGLNGEAAAHEDEIPDLIISDLKMPKLNGDEVLKKVRSDPRFLSVPFVVLSSSDMATEVDRCLNLGASEFCQKPVDYESYVECLRAIARKYLVHDNTASEPPCSLSASTRT